MAASQALQTGGDVKLVAMADAFPDRVQSCLETLTGDELHCGSVRLEASSGPLYGFVRRLADKGIGLLELKRGVPRAQLQEFCEQLAMLEGVLKDERRHIGFGENALGRRLQTAPELRLKLRRIREELDRLVLASFEETATTLGIPTAERTRMGATYLDATARLGVGP